MKYEHIVTDIKGIMRAKPLWEALLKALSHKSIHFPQVYAELTFDKKLEKLNKKAKIRLELVRYENIDIGFCLCSVDAEGNGELDALYITESHRAKGLGDSLVVNAKSWFEACNAKDIKLNVTYGNEQVFPFYAKHGFLPIRYDLIYKTGKD